MASAPAVAVHHPAGGHIFVSNNSLPGQCYHEVGPVTYNEPYYQSVIDTDDAQLDERLRAIARQKYPNGLDAIIDVQKNQNDVGTEVQVTGRAVTMSDTVTAECVLRAAPGAIDSASQMVAGGIAGTVVGGLIGNSGNTSSAEAGGAIGAIGTGAIQQINRNQAQQEAQNDLNNRIAAQQARITRLQSELAKLISDQCDNEELSPAQCNQRVTEVERTTIGPAAPAGTPVTASAAAIGPPIVSNFDVQNRLQAQAETIDRLQNQIATMKHQADTH